MKRNQAPSNPYAEIGAEIAVLLMTLHEASVEKLQHSNQSEEWKLGYENAISNVIIAMSKAYIPTLKERSDEWELFKQNFETN